MPAAINNYRSGISMTLAGTADVDYAVETLYHDPVVCDVETVYIKAATAISFSHNALNMCGRAAPSGSTTYAPANGDVGQIRYWVDGDMNSGHRWTRYYSATNATGTITDRGETTAPAFTAPLSFSTLQYPAPGPNSGTTVLGTTGNNGTDNRNRLTYFTYGLLDSVSDEWHTVQTWDDDSMPENRPGDSEWWASDGKVRIFVVNPKTPCLTWAVTGTGQFYTTPAKVYDLPKIHDQQTYFQAGTSGTVSVTIRDINGNHVFYRVGTSGSFIDAEASAVTLDQNDFANGTNTLQYYYDGNDDYIKTRIVVKNPAFPSANETHGLLLWGSAEKKARWVEEVVTPNTYWWLRYKNGQSSTRDTIATSPAGNRHYPSEALRHALLTDQLGSTAGGVTPYATFAKNMLLNNLQRLDMVGQKGPHVQDAAPCREIYYRGYYDSTHVFDLALGYDTLIACFKSTDHATGVTPIEDYYIRDLIGKAVMSSVSDMRSDTGTPSTGGMWDTARRCAAVAGALAMPDYDTPYHGKSGFNRTTTGGYEWAPFPTSLYSWKQLFVDNNMSMTQYPDYSGRLGIEEGNCRADGVFLDRPVYFGQMGPDMSAAATLINRFDNSKTFPGLQACLVNAVNGTLIGVKGSDGPQKVIVPVGYNKSLPLAQAAGVPYLQANPSGFNQSAESAPLQWGFYDSQTAGLQTISTGSYRHGDALTAWPLWTAVQRGQSTDPGYVTTPPGNWLTPTRAIMSAGDLIGVKAACSERCGTLSVEFSLNNGALLTVSNPTIETDQWGKTEAYWFKLPAGLSNGLHEIRARIKPSLSGNERLLQSAAGASLGSYSDQGTHSLLIAVDNRNYYAQVAVGGTATGAAGVGQASTPNAALPKYASVAAAHSALKVAMGGTTSSTAGATIYLGAGDWRVSTEYTPDDAYWLTIKGAPGVVRADIRISLPHNDGGGDNPNVFAKYLKVQGVTLIQHPQHPLLYRPGSGANHLIWLDDFVYQGRGTTEWGGGSIVNSTGISHPVTRGQVREVKAGHVAHMASGFVRNVDYYRNTGDVFTGATFIVNSVVTECRGLGLNSGGDPNDTEHADVYQNMGGLSNLILCNIRASSVRLSAPAAGPYGGDVGVAALQQVENAGDGWVVQRSQNCLFQNISLSGFEGAVGFMGADPIGVLIHHCSFSNWFDLDSRTTTPGLPPTIGSGVAGTYNGCEIINSIFYASTYSVVSHGLIAKLRSVGAYRGNHFISAIADSTDTLGALTYNSGTLVPNNTTVLAGRRAPAGTLTDAVGAVRIQASTTAGAFSTLLESGATSAPVLPPGLTLNTVSGLIYGTPTTPGTYSLTVSATNSAGTGTKSLTIIINPAPIPAPNITSGSAVTGQVGVTFSYQITATDNPTLYGVLPRYPAPTPTPSPSATPTPYVTPTPTPSATPTPANPVLTASSTSGLAWTASTTSDVTGYRVYYGQAPGIYSKTRGNGLFVNNVTTYVVTGLTPGVWYFAVTAINAFGVESNFSNEVSRTLVSEISQYGITWKFRHGHEIGQFVNGDYYVVAPPEGIIVDSVTPDAASGRHGAMINPGLDSHAWDDRISGYTPALNTTFPYVLKPGESLVKVISILDAEWVNGKYTTDWQGLRSDSYVLKTSAVLTCLSSRPAADSFRPPYIGSNKPIYKYSSVNPDWFPNLPTPSLLTSTQITYLERGLTRPWLITPFAHHADEAHPVENQPGYHREVGSFLSEASLALCTQASTAALKIGFIQMGLDYYGMASQTTGTGDSSFWKWPVIFTGLLLGEANIYHLFSNGVYRGIPRDGEKFYYIKDGTSSNLSLSVVGNNIKPFKKTWTGSRVGFRKGLGNEEHEHLHPSEWGIVASGGGGKQEGYRWCCDSRPSTDQIFAAMIISRNDARPAIQAGTGYSRFADTPIKCFYPAGSSFDGGNTEEFSAFDYTFRFMKEPFEESFLGVVQTHYPLFEFPETQPSYSQQLWDELGDGLMSNTEEYTISPYARIVDGEIISPSPDPELTNYKGGIDVHFGDSATMGTDKGVGYQEEYWFHDKLVNDTKAVWIRADTTISMRHNDRNMGSTSGRAKVLIGADGGGLIRYKIDGVWKEVQWAPKYDGTGTTYPAYPGPSMNLASTGVVGVTGYNAAGNYWQGLVDSVGDEWHILMVADDDSALGGLDDAWASDGKYMLLCVNPKTPAMTVRAEVGEGQFYTTPAWTYWVPRIHDQTTYFQGACTFELNNIYGGNISYRINGGGIVAGSAATVTLNEAHFTEGNNILEYWYDSTPGTTRTRTIVKNPTHPGIPEDHGTRVLGGDAGWTKFQSRAARSPYKPLIDSAKSRNASGQIDWENSGRKGLRFGGYNWPFAYRNNFSGHNAILAKHLGWDAYASGAFGNKSYAAYAKEMLLESPLTQHPVGFETSFWASSPIPAADTIYRGYWDADFAYSAATAYDILMDGYRSDQAAGGITPIEDYYLRDMLASWCHLAALSIGGVASEYDTGMWTVSRAIGAAWCAAVMPNYSNPYYGTSGFDGNTTVYQWAPFRDANFTWKDYFFDDDHVVGSTNWAGPVLRLGLEGPQNGHRQGSTTSIIAKPLIRNPSESPFAMWGDKADYASWGQVGHNIANYALLKAQYGNLNNHPILMEFINQVTKGTLYGQKDPIGPTRVHMITLLNDKFPQAIENARAWIQALPITNDNSEATALRDSGLIAIAFYDDGFGAS